MSSISQEWPNFDRISNLPDHLIAHILSFLSTEDTVKTSVLSTAWKQQWKSVPLIRFAESTQRPRLTSTRFLIFVYRVLHNNNVTPLDLFQLTYGIYEARDIRNWIYVLVSRHVRQIDIRTVMQTYCRLPDCVYSSKTLVVLKLRGNFVFQVPEKISLESLKIFHYRADHSQPVSDDSEIGGNYDVGESISRLVSSCPVLEELEIIGILEKKLRILNLSSLALKRLILEDLQDNYRPDAYKLVLNTPNLQYFEQNDHYGVPGSYRINTLHCLDTASFDFYLGDYEFGQLAQARPLAELVVTISNVRVLYILQDSFVNLYSTALPNFELPKFDRLISLELVTVYSDAGLRLLFGFLQSSRQLESLSFYVGCCPDETWNPPAKTWHPPTDVPYCMIHNLKVIKVDFYDEQEPAVLNVLTYFLEKTNCLEELILHPEKKEEEFIKKLSMLPRASKSCRIVLT